MEIREGVFLLLTNGKTVRATGPMVRKQTCAESSPIPGWGEVCEVPIKRPDGSVGVVQASEVKEVLD